MRLRDLARTMYIALTLSACGNASLLADRPVEAVLSIIALIWLLGGLIAEWRRLKHADH